MIFSPPHEFDCLTAELHIFGYVIRVNPLFLCFGRQNVPASLLLSGRGIRSVLSRRFFAAGGKYRKQHGENKK